MNGWTPGSDSSPIAPALHPVSPDGIRTTRGLAVVSRTESPWLFHDCFFMTTNCSSPFSFAPGTPDPSGAENHFPVPGTLAMLSDDYQRPAPNPSEVPCRELLVVDGRHGRTLVSRTLPIWDIDSIDLMADDESLLNHFQAQLEGFAPGFSFRLYRTLAGVRVVCTSYAIDLTDPEHLEGFMELGRQIGADPIYMELCRKQQTCRARLVKKKSGHGVAAPANARACRLIGEDIGNGTPTRR